MVDVTLTLNGIDISAPNVNITKHESVDPVRMEPQVHIEIDNAIASDPNELDDLVESLNHDDLRPDKN